MDCSNVAYSEKSKRRVGSDSDPKCDAQTKFSKTLFLSYHIMNSQQTIAVTQGTGSQGVHLSPRRSERIHPRRMLTKL